MSSAMLGQPSSVFSICHITRRPGESFAKAQPSKEHSSSTLHNKRHLMRLLACNSASGSSYCSNSVRGRTKTFCQPTGRTWFCQVLPEPAADGLRQNLTLPNREIPQSVRANAFI